MASKNLFCLFFLACILLLLTSGISAFGGHGHGHSPDSSSASPSRYRPRISAAHFLSTFSPPAISNYPPAITGGGEWALLQESIGISAMHMQLLHNNKVVMFDRKDFGPSNLTLPTGKCRDDDGAVSEECTAHSIIYDVVSNTYRPLMVQTDVWCSSGAVNSDGMLIQTGGYLAGNRKIRVFAPCDDDTCDWIELPQNLTVRRWYSSDQILPDGRMIVVGGRRAFSYEFFPKIPSQETVFLFPFLIKTTDPKEENNLYPFLHLLPDGNLFIFANQHSVILDYNNNRIVKELPMIPGEKRSYPATGSSVMLPIELTPGEYGSPSSAPAVEVMVCGGAAGGAFVKALTGSYVSASKSCGRIRVMDPGPKWEMEDMPVGRVMPDMLLLPTGDLIILNGAAKGTAGWECADEPILNPVLYSPKDPDLRARFSVLNPTTIARVYHSAAILLPDGRILIGGSNPHVRYTFTGVRYPTELSLESFSPPYLAPEYTHLRPSIVTIEGPNGDFISYGQQFAITFSLGFYTLAGDCKVTMIAPSFTTHSFAMSQRLLVLYLVLQQQLSAFDYKVLVYAPPTANVAPPGYYMLFVLNQGIPSHSVWIRIG